MTNNRRLGVSKKYGPEIIGVIDYSSFYGKPVTDDVFEKLSKYPTDILIIMLARLNSLVFANSGHPSRIDNAVFLHVFDKLGKPLYEHIAKIRSTKEGKYGAIYTAPTIVSLMAKLVAMPKPVAENDKLVAITEHVMQRELFDAILATNDNYYNRANSKNMMSYEHIWRLDLFQQAFARNTQNMMGVIPFKIFLFFRFMSDRYGESILQEFADAFKIASAYNFYFVFFQMIAATYSAYEKDGKPHFFIANETLERVVEPFTFDTTKPQSFPYSGESFTIINQPFYRFPEGLAILDFSFFSLITEVSLFYHFYYLTSLKGKHGIKNYNEYAAKIGKDYYEEYIALEIIKKIFNHAYDKVQSEMDDPLHPDILVFQNNKDVFVIEVKSTRVHGKVLDQVDTDAFKLFLLDAFANEKQQKGQKNKGIYQLKNQIEYLKTKGSGFRIFPIIVYTESSLDIGGVNTFLDDKFETIITKQKSSFLKIHPLTLINLNFFIKYYPTLKAERYFLRDKLTEYHKKRKKQLNEAHKKHNSWVYLIGQFSFMRFMEKTYPTGDPMSYFKMAATDFGFGEQAEFPE